MTEQELQSELRRLTDDERDHDPDGQEREEDSTPPEIFVPSKEDIYQLSHRHLETFLELDYGANVLMALCENSNRPWDNFVRVSQYLSAEDKRSLLDYFDDTKERDRHYGDYWHAYKYRFPDRGFRPADLDRVVLLARSMPEEQWGEVFDHGYSGDLYEALKMAVEEKATAEKPDWKKSGF